MLKYFTFRPTKTHIARFFLSLVLAMLLWGWVTQLQDPYKDKIFYNVPILASSLPDNLQVITTMPAATVTLSGAASDLKAIPAVSVSLDASDITKPGEYRVPVHVKEVSGISSRKVDPKEVQIQVEETQSKVFPLTIDTASLATSDSRRISSVKPNISQVTATGPSSAVARISKVVLPVAANQQVATFTGEFAPVAVDANGQQIAEVNLLPATISAEVTVETRGKQVSVVPQVTGIPADGYTVQQRAAFPDTIIVDGPSAELDKLLFVDTEPVDVNGESKSISKQVGIADLPEGLSIVSPVGGTVEVRVAIEDTTSQATVFSALTIEPLGLSSSLTAEFTPYQLDVSVHAPRSLLQTLEAKDVKVVADLTGLEPGTYTVEPKVIVPQGVTWLGNKPDRVLVKITRNTATPSSTPTTPRGTPVGVIDRPTPIQAHRSSGTRERRGHSSKR